MLKYFGISMTISQIYAYLAKFYGHEQVEQFQKEGIDSNMLNQALNYILDAEQLTGDDGFNNFLNGENVIIGEVEYNYVNGVMIPGQPLYTDPKEGAANGVEVGGHVLLILFAFESGNETFYYVYDPATGTTNTIPVGDLYINSAHGINGVNGDFEDWWERSNYQAPEQGAGGVGEWRG